MSGFEYGDPVVIQTETGNRVNITDMFWSIVQEARWFELYPDVSKGKIEQCGKRLGMALGHEALMPIASQMSPFIPQEYEDALRECWQGIINAIEIAEDEDEENEQPRRTRRP